MALTAAQIFENIGRMLKHGANNVHSIGEEDIKFLMRYAKSYKLNGSGGGYSEADRAEAMVEAKEFLFEADTGLDPATKAHLMDSHWLPDAESE